VEQPEGFEVQDRKTHVCRLKKALYGLKQAPMTWYERIDNYLTKLGFTRSDADPNQGAMGFTRSFMWMISF